ncbi:hypothetical protein HY991_04905, partial [Candidatus Micrarchaeota archaeon]|nr:hypothetical protein [Candidatus Micrarchaeota archaeon]
MGISESWEDFVASLEEKGVPNPRVLIPLLVLIVLVAVGYFVYQSYFTGKTLDLTVTVKDAYGPLPNAKVNLLINGAVKKSANTDTSGVATFKKVFIPSGASVSAEASAEGYKQNEAAIEGEETSVTISLSREKLELKSVRVNVVDEDNHVVSGADVTLATDDGTPATVRTNSGGVAEFKLEQIPEHATLTAEKEGFEKNEMSADKTQLEGGVEIILKAKEAEKEVGTLKVRVVDSKTEESAKNIRVKLIDAVTQGTYRDEISGEDGFASFKNVELSKEFYITAKDPAGKYLEYAGEETVTMEDTLQLEIIRIEAAPEKPEEKPKNEIVFSVRNKEDNAVIGNAEINLFDKTTGKLVAKEFTDENGAAKFSVAAGKTFYATAYALDFLPGFYPELKAGDSKTFLLEKESEENYVSAEVVVQEDGNPAANAQVSLYREDGFFLGIPAMTTDADGVATTRIPREWEGKPYSVYAVASRGTKFGRSSVVEVSDETSLTIALEAPKARLEVTAKNILSNASISSASISIVIEGAVIAECSSKNGTCYFELPSGREFSILASAQNFIQATSSPLTLKPGELKKVVIFLYPSSTGLSIKFLGLYKGDRRVLETAGAEVYRAKFLVTFPSVERGGFYLRIGDKEDVYEDVAGIESIEFDAPVIYSSTKQDENCSAVEAESNDLLKWVQIEFPKGFVGTKELDFDVYVKETAAVGDKIKFYYRAYAIKNGTPYTTPVDEELTAELRARVAAGEVLKIQDFCKAKTVSATIPVSGEPLVCEEGLCTRFSFESPNGERGGEGFPVELGKEFTANFVLFSDKKIESIGVRSDYVNVLGMSTASLEETASTESSSISSKETRLPVSVPPKSKKTGSIRLKGIRIGTASIEFIIHFADGKKVVQSLVEVTGTNPLNVDVYPSELIVGEKGTVKVTASDKLGNPVKDAHVSIYECDGTPLDGNQIDVQGDGTVGNGEDGKYSIKVTPSSIGFLGVKVSGEGYKSFDACTIDVYATDFIEVEPDTLSFEGDSTKEALRQQVTVASLLPLRSRITSSVSCANASGSILKIFPESFNLKDSKTVSVEVKQGTTADTDCMILFNARINKKSVSTKEVLTRVKVFASPEPTPTPSPTVLPPVLPRSIALKVSEENPQDTVSFKVSLPEDPEECRIEGFKKRDGALTQPYSYGYPTFGFGGGYGYGGYGTGYGTSGYGGYGTGYGTPGYGVYGGGYAGGYAGAYGAGYGFSTPGYGTGYGIGFGSGYPQGSYPYGHEFNPSYVSGISPECMVPNICYNPRGCIYCITMTPPFVPPQYPANYPLQCRADTMMSPICSNPQVCPFCQGISSYSPYSSSFFQGPYLSQMSRRDFATVTADICTKDEIQVSAEYTSDFYQPLPSMTQKGSLYVKLGPGLTRRIPITVKVEGLAPFQPYPYSPVPGMLQPFSWSYPTQTGWIPQPTRFAPEGIPEEIVIKLNRFTLKGTYSADLKLPSNAKLLCPTEAKFKGTLK